MQVIVIEVTGGITGNAITFNCRLSLQQIDSVYGLVLLISCEQIIGPIGNRVYGCARFKRAKW